MLEIQASTPEKPSKGPTWRGVVVAYVIVALCYFPVALIGYWMFGNSVQDNILILLEKPAWLIALANMFVIVHVIGSYQIYAMPVFDIIESVLVKKLHFNSAQTLRGFAFARTAYFFPCIMWLAISKPRRFSLSWWTNWICIVIGVLLMWGRSNNVDSCKLWVEINTAANSIDASSVECGPSLRVSRGAAEEIGTLNPGSDKWTRYFVLPLVWLVVSILASFQRSNMILETLVHWILSLTASFHCLGDALSQIYTMHSLQIPFLPRFSKEMKLKQISRYYLSMEFEVGRMTLGGLLALGYIVVLSGKQESLDPAL
ncbi:hypothetical protein NL676_019969 [Syzygium grande]|nr:hypothetical protein NL676_019969 [Syzygium grande]